MGGMVDVKDDARVDEIERLYREQGDRMWWAILAYAGDREIASDAVAEAFAQLLRRGDRVRAPDRWVWRTVFRIAAGELHRRQSDGPLAPTPPPGELPGVALELLDVLARLPRKQRAAVVLHHLHGYRVREIADVIGSTTAAVKVHLSRGRKRLRAILEESEDA